MLIRWMLRGLLCLPLVAILAGCGRSPCEECPDVAGIYEITAAPTSPSDSSCGTLYYTGFSGYLVIDQDESLLMLDDLEGTLFKNGTAEFEPFDSRTAAGEPGTATWFAAFREQDDGAMHIDGHIHFVRTHDACFVRALYMGERVD